MEPQQARQRTACRSNGFVAVAGLLMLGAWSPEASAARNGIDCDNIARNMKSLDVTGEALAISIVEHMAIAAEQDFESPPRDIPVSDAVAPVLLLTPRVASILREVFGTDVVRTDLQVEDGSDALAPEVRPSPVPPVAKDEGTAQRPSTIAPMLRDETAGQYMPSFQRQMYRTDI